MSRSFACPVNFWVSRGKVPVLSGRVVQLDPPPPWRAATWRFLVLVPLSGTACTQKAYSCTARPQSVTYIHTLSRDVCFVASHSSASARGRPMQQPTRKSLSLGSSSWLMHEYYGNWQRTTEQSRPRQRSIFGAGCRSWRQTGPRLIDQAHSFQQLYLPTASKCTAAERLQ